MQPYVEAEAEAEVEPFYRRRVLMEGSSWRPAVGIPVGEPSTPVAVDGDWRSQLGPEARQRIVKKIMDTLKRHLPFSVPEGLIQLEKIAVRFEEKIYTAATNQTDYLRRISLKMLSMETKTGASVIINQSLSNPSVGSQSPADSGIHMESMMSPISFNCNSKRERTPTIIDCEADSTFKDDYNEKRKKVMNPKEPAFTCPVCLNELVESCSTICGHIFCQGCIKMTVQKLKKCPTCTRALTMKSFHRIYLPTIEFNSDSP